MGDPWLNQSKPTERIGAGDIRLTGAGDALWSERMMPDAVETGILGLGWTSLDTFGPVTIASVLY